MAKNEVLNLEDVLDLEVSKQKRKYVPRQVSKEQDEASEQRTLRKSHLQQQQIKAPKQSVGITDSITALRRHAKSILTNFVSNTPKIKEIKQRIEVLKIGIAKYKKLGDTESVQKCKDEIENLTDMVKQYESAVSNKSKEERDKLNETIGTDQKFIELSNEIDSIKKQLRTENASSLVGRFEKLRALIEFDKRNAGKDEDEIAEHEKELQKILEEDDLFDDEVSGNVNTDNFITIHHKSYDELIKLFAGILDYSEEEIVNMTGAELRKQLKEYENTENVRELKERIDILKTQRNIRIQQLKGYHEITDVMYQIFDYQEPMDEPVAKNVIAARMIDYVCVIGNNLAKQFNMFHYKEDIISYGLEKLADRINKWYEVQKSINSPISVHSFIGNFVALRMKAGIAELTKAGVISGTNFYTQMNKSKKKIDKRVAELLAENPQLPEEMARNIAEKEQVAILGSDSVTTMTEMAQTISRGSKDDDAVDPYNFIADKEADSNSVAEIKLAYNELAKSINDLLEYMEPVVKRGKVVGKKPLFDKYQKRAFMLLFGFEMKRNPETGGKEMYSNEEIGNIIAQMYHDDGDKSKTISDSATSTRKAKIIEKIQKLLIAEPKFVNTFKYIYQFIQDNETGWGMLSADNIQNDYQNYFKPKSIDLEEKSNEIDLNTVLGDVDDYSDVFDLSSDWTEMVDFTGIKF